MGRALVLDDGDTEVALLSTDLGVPFEKDSLVARVKDLGFTHETILYTGTHTHSGPDGLADWQVEQLARAIRKAHAERVPVRAAWGTQRVLDVNRNRSIEAHLANHGLDLFYGQGDQTDDPRGAEHSRNTRLRILRVDRLDGRPLAGWIHFPVHLTTSAPDVDIWDSDLAVAATHHLQTAVGAAGLHGPLHERRAGRPDAALRLLQPHRGDGPARQADRREGDAGVAGGGRAPAAQGGRRRALDALVLLRPGGRARPPRERHAVLGAGLLRRVGGRRVDLPRAGLHRGPAAAGGRLTPGSRPEDPRYARDRPRGRPGGARRTCRRPPAPGGAGRAECRDGAAVRGRRQAAAAPGSQGARRRRPGERLHGLPHHARGVPDAALRGRAHRVRHLDLVARA